MEKQFFRVDENGFILDLYLKRDVQAGWLLVDTDMGTALSMIRPRWNGTAWEETADADALAERDQAMQDVLQASEEAMRPAVLQRRVNELTLEALAPSLTDEQRLEVVGAWPEFVAGETYRQGTVGWYGEPGRLYEVVLAGGVTVQAHQPPGGEGMLAVYRPIQREAEPGQVLPWVYGEAVKVGDKREYNGVVYEAYAPAGANTHSPDLVPAVWRVSE